MLASDFIATLFGGRTEGQVFVNALVNGGGGQVAQVVGRDGDTIDQFVAKHDFKGGDRGIYFCVSTLSAPKRVKENVAEIHMLHQDIDLKDLEGDVSPQAVELALRFMPCPPSVITFSGNGVHAYWLLNEVLGPDAIHGVEELLRHLADHVGGDRQCCEVSRLMRLPGTHNSKGGAWTEVTVELFEPDRRYDIEQIEEMLEDGRQPLFKRKPKVWTALDQSTTNPFLNVAIDQGYKPPVDVEADLAAMTVGGGENGVHATQLRCTASLLSRGEDIETVVGKVSLATQAAASRAGEAARWNWRKEEGAIRKMCETWRAKHPELAGPPVGDRSNSNSGAVAGRSGSTGNQPVRSGEQGSVVSLKDERAKRERAKAAPEKKEKGPDIAQLGTIVLEGLAKEGKAILFQGKVGWRYEAGLWTMETDGLQAWLNMQTERACRAISQKTSNRLVSEVRQWIMRSPDLWRDEIPWDRHGKVPTLSGLVDPKTLVLEPFKPEHYCTWVVNSEYDPQAKCPWWEVMLADTFADRPKPVAVETAAVIQEVLGASLLDMKPRPLSKALLLLGGSSVGKSAILEVLGGLHTDTPIAADLLGISKSAHGLQDFMRRAPWVLHEAFDASNWHSASSVKAIVTGEPVNINIKNGPMVSKRIYAPIFWGSNHSNKLKEATDAIVNRFVVIRCKRLFREEVLVGAGAEAARQGLDKPSTLVLRDEKPGVLNWAIEGLRRAQARGTIQVTEEIRDAGHEMKRDSNLVAGFIEECVTFAPKSMVGVPDFSLAFSIWWMEHHGEDRRVPSNDMIGRAVSALADNRIGIHTKELRDMRQRYYAGVVLNDRGLELWGHAKLSSAFEGKRVTASADVVHVNKPIPPSWMSRPSVEAVMRAHIEHAATVMPYVTPTATEAVIGSDTAYRHGEQDLDDPHKPPF